MFVELVGFFRVISYIMFYIKILISHAQTKLIKSQLSRGPKFPKIARPERLARGIPMNMYYF